MLFTCQRKGTPTPVDRQTRTAAEQRPSMRRQRAASSAACTALLIVCSISCSIGAFAPVDAFYPGPQVLVWGGRKRRGRLQQQRIPSLSSPHPEPLNGKNEPSSEGENQSDRDGRRKRRRMTTNHNTTAVPTAMEIELFHRVTQLEQLVSKQNVELERLKRECEDLTHAAQAFARVVELLRQAGLPTTETNTEILTTRPSDNDSGEKVQKEESKTVVESFDDSIIFGTAPRNVIEAADAAGASILAGMLAGKQRMLVDVRDADLSKDPEALVQFIELAVLPVAAGLEGLKSKRNRLKIVFPTVSQLHDYRKTMTLAAPEVVALSTLGFDPVEEQDNLVVLVAPSPDDEEGLEVMNALLRVDDSETSDTASDIRPIKQPVVVLNHHMIPITGPAASFEVAYHLRLLSVQYMAAGTNSPQEYLSKFTETSDGRDEANSTVAKNATALADGGCDDNDAALEAAMERAQQVGMHTGVTRAMVIRAYPQPWHVFVDTSPDTDADFEVAATFDDEPSTDHVNIAIVECLEGSEREDELVAQQMQQALETGQLDRISEMLGSLGLDAFDDLSEDDEDDLWDAFDEDSV